MGPSLIACMAFSEFLDLGRSCFERYSGMHSTCSCSKAVSSRSTHEQILVPARTSSTHTPCTNLATQKTRSSPLPLHSETVLLPNNPLHRTLRSDSPFSKESKSDVTFLWRPVLNFLSLRFSFAVGGDPFPVASIEIPSASWL